MLENEIDASRGSGVLLAPDMVSFASRRDPTCAEGVSHLLLTYPTPSNALESFILERAEESTHSAMLVCLPQSHVCSANLKTFWFMQAALRDLIPTRTTNPRPFAICQRVLHKCHEIIFGDPPEPSRSPYRSLPHSPPASTVALLASPMTNLLKNKLLDDAARPKVRVNPHVPPALVGMGTVLAAIGMPGATDMAGTWAVLQGRRPRDDEGESRARVEVDKSGGADLPPDTKVVLEKKSEEQVSSDEEEKAPTPPRKGPFATIRAVPSPGTTFRSGPSTAPPMASAFTLPHPASTAPTLYSPPNVESPETSPFGSPMPPADTDPFSQNEPDLAGPSRSRTDTPPKQHQPFYSVPEFSTSTPHNSALRRLHASERPPPADTLLATYSPGAQTLLLRSHYCRSEVRFLLILEDISNRLLVVPKPARVSALRAELTSLNHNLPAEVRIFLLFGMLLTFTDLHATVVWCRS